MNPVEETETRKKFMESGTRFFQWNGGKNTPNILINLGAEIAKLETRCAQLQGELGKIETATRAASESSARLARALNGLTAAMVLIALAALIKSFF